MSSEDHGAAVARALLRAELRRYRVNRNETQEAVAAACEWSVAKFHRIENGTSTITRADLEWLLRHYGVDEDHIRQLTELAREARRPGWWQDYDFGPDKGLEAYVGYEDGASSIRVWQPLTIPGLLRTSDYAGKIMEVWGASPEATDRAVRLQQERQRRVAERLPEQHYLLDEAVIRRASGTGMSDQLRHLTSVATNPAITIRIIPFSAGPHFGQRGPFVLLGFDGALDDVLYVESARRGDLLMAEVKDWLAGPSIPKTEEPATEVASYEDGFDGLLRIALDPTESLELIGHVAEQLD